ncbi:MAG: NAD-dependent epimerase/dehydratase family protein [Acidobacteria bacterium]|nr:NAD-dependent epimerase/dehydratase family protein [Acidobacteriota bacterium]
MSTELERTFTILVTGASGYIGACLCRRALERGLGLVVVGRRRPHTVGSGDAVFHSFDPLGLTADTDWGLLPHWYDSRLFAGVLLLGLLTRIAWRASTTPMLRPIAFGLIWFAAALAPASSFFPLAEVANGHRG